MSSYVPAALRRAVAARAGFACEYCLIREADTFFGCEVEHVIAEKHGGPTEEQNLAYACLPVHPAQGDGPRIPRPGDRPARLSVRSA